MNKVTEEKVRTLPIIVLVMVPFLGMLMMMQLDIKRYFLIIAVMAWYVSSMIIRIIVNFGIRFMISGEELEIYRRKNIELSFFIRDIFLFKPLDRQVQKEMSTGEKKGSLRRFVLPLNGTPWVIGYKKDETYHYLTFQPGNSFQKALEGKIKKKRKHVSK